ncbi:MAG TPA: UvrD-helicase domain-containing protein [Candidatus Paceibacterota bacterium]|nr:UvrD-helicase domain-containing protein [Candidatus Paceibacterota bacterium]
MDLIEGLNDAQKRAVLATDGPVLIVAGAGAGKTKTLVHRIGYLISKGVLPSAILAVTFTNKAAREMRERVHTLIERLPLGSAPQATPFVSTFHSLGVYLLRKFGAFGGTAKRFSLLDESDSLALIKEAQSSLGIDPKTLEPRAVRNAISKAANALETVDTLASSTTPHHRLIARLWSAYATLKREHKALDFDDLLIQTAELLKENTDAREWCHAQWEYIHIDEYQDTNDVQYKIAQVLAGPRKNICAVGDSDQSIYSWRGANIKNILEFEHDYPDATVILLEENYRSTKTVIAAANELIQKNKYRQPKHLFTNNSTGDKIIIYAAYDESDEAEYIVERAIEALDAGVPANEIAVLYRTNFQSRVLEEAFLAHTIPYQVLGVRFFDRKEVKDVLSYIRAALNPEALLDMRRVFTTPPRGIGKVTLAKLFAGGKESISGKQRVTIDNLYKLLENIVAFAHANSIQETIKYVIKTSGLEAMYESQADGEERIENLRELVTIATRYSSSDTVEGLEHMLEEATLVSDQDTLDEKEKRGNGVKLMTIHAAKGLEFDTVFIAGLEQGLFPHERDAKQMGADGEEERRLMYVALTRARKKLFLTYASVRTIYGMRDVRMPSEFLIDIPPELIEHDSREGESGSGTIYV